MKKIKIDKNKILSAILFIVYLILSFILLKNHEIWTDEAQAWEIAKNLSIPEIFAQMKYEAHPCFWHLILAIPSKLGLPVISMNIISWIITSISVYIILFHSKLNIILKTIIIFNPSFIFFSSVIARNYCLVNLFLALFSITYDKRFKHPIIYTIILGLLAHTHMIICGFVGIAAILFILENIKKKNYKQLKISLIILLLFFIVLAIQIIPSLSNCVFIETEGQVGQSKLLNTAEQIGSLFFITINPKTHLIFLIIFIILSTLLTFINNKKKAIILLISVLTIFMLHLRWPFGLNERTSIIFTIIIFLNLDNKNILYTIFICIISMLITFTNYPEVKKDLYSEFSDSKNAAMFINKNIKDNSLIITLDIDRHVSVIPYVYEHKNITWFNIQNNEFQTYITWNEEAFIERDYESIENKIYAVSKNYKNVYILCGIDFNGNKYHKETIEKLTNRKKITHEIYSTKNTYTRELFYIYEYFKH